MPSSSVRVPTNWDWSTSAASAANLWELVIKGGRPDALTDNPVQWWVKYVTRSRIPVLSIRTRHVRALAALPGIHKDPSTGFWSRRR
jgi:PIN domain nuclease of toxin-antitoxin system